MEYQYYIAAGKSLDALMACVASWDECFQRRKEFAATMGMECVVSVEGTAVGACTFLADKLDPKDYNAKPVLVPEKGAKMCLERIEGKYHTVLRPHGSTKAAKDFRAALAKLRQQTIREVVSRLGCGGVISEGRHHYPVAYTLGEKWIFRLPLGEDRKPISPPPDAVPLKASEYWQMVEEWDSKQAKKKSR